MSYWNYRVVKKRNEKCNADYYEVCEVYYDKNSIPHSWSVGYNLLLSHEELDDLKESYENIQSAFKKPVLQVKNGKLIEL